MRRVKWLFKQLFPLKYATVSRPVRSGVTGEPVFTTWRMWFGRCFNVQRITV